MAVPGMGPKQIYHQFRLAWCSSVWTSVMDLSLKQPSDALLSAHSCRSITHQLDGFAPISVNLPNTCGDGRDVYFADGG